MYDGARDKSYPKKISQNELGLNRLERDQNVCEKYECKILVWGNEKKKNQSKIRQIQSTKQRSEQPHHRNEHKKKIQLTKYLNVCMIRRDGNSNATIQIAAEKTNVLT